jgi:hypothetical protein
MSKIGTIRVGSIYLHGEQWYTGDAEKTIGQPLLGVNAQKIAENRYAVTGKLTPDGEDALQRATATFRDLIKADPKIKLVVKWDIHCGCTMCPCSPGFKVHVEYNREAVDAPASLKSRRTAEMTWHNVQVTSDREIKSHKSPYAVVLNFIAQLNKLV